MGESPSHRPGFGANASLPGGAQPKWPRRRPRLSNVPLPDPRPNRDQPDSADFPEPFAGADRRKQVAATGLPVVVQHHLLQPALGFKLADMPTG